MAINDDTWKMVQEHLGYNEEEMNLFRSYPRNEDALSKTAAMLNKTIIAEIIESHGCDSGHKAGDKFYFDGRGISLLTKRSPGKICIFALHAIALAMPALAELFYAGIDPNTMRFRRFECPDVGIRCGRWRTYHYEITNRRTSEIWINKKKQRKEVGEHGAGDGNKETIRTG